jgi:hypothetical protein
MLFDTRSRSAHKNPKISSWDLRLTASYKHSSGIQGFSTPEYITNLYSVSTLNTLYMSLAKPILLLLFCVPLTLSPSQSAGQEPTLAMPLVSQTPSDTINHYLAPMTEYGEGHRGIDLATFIGDEVLSPSNGEISFSGKVGYRDVVSVRFGSSLTASMEPVCSSLVAGPAVMMGDVIGLVCQPDAEYVWHCEMICLHFGTRTDAGYFSPLALIGGLSPSKLVYQARG